MRSIFTTLCLAFLTLPVFSQTVINDPNAEERTVTAGFTGVYVSSGIQLILTQGTENKVVVSASETKYRDKIKTEVENGVLKISYEHKPVNISWNGGGRKELKAYVSIKTIDKLRASSGSSVDISGELNASSLSVDVSSGAFIKGKIHTQQMDVDLSSGASISIQGSANRLSVEASSGASFNSFDFNTETTEAEASSGASVKVSISKELKAKASSGGSIKYKGDAVIKDIDVSSGGTVKKA